MKLKEITENKKTPDGTYAAVKFSDKTNQAVLKYLKQHKIPNATKASDIHTTLLFSRKFLPNYKPAGIYETPITGHPTGFNIWPDKDSEGNPKTVLVLTMSCPELSKRHKYLMDEHQATYDFDEYRPHITFSNNVGDFSVDDLEPFEENLEIVKEYSEDLDLS